MGLRRRRLREYGGRDVRISIVKRRAGEREWCVRYRHSGASEDGGNHDALVSALMHARDQVQSMAGDLGGEVSWHTSIGDLAVQVTEDGDATCN